jgi:hypothetical protein
MNKQTLYIGLVAVIIVAGGIWYFEANNTKTVTAPTVPPQASSSIVTYTNAQYGFTFTLPAAWAGYSIVTSTWTGDSQPPVTGSIISIRNPAWTASVPTQDIPIMVFTPSEWAEVSSGTLAVSAAPIAPSELGQNSQYVFALPARYNYAYPADYQEVETILAGNPLSASN